LTLLIPDGSQKRMQLFNDDVDVDVERKQAQAIASLPDSITQLLCLL